MDHGRDKLATHGWRSGAIPADQPNDRGAVPDTAPVLTEPFSLRPPTSPSGSSSNACSCEAEFEAWWAEYPRKVGKLAAQKAYQKARRIASAPVLLSGLLSLSRDVTDLRYCPHPTTWLNQGRWMDETTTRTTNPGGNGSRTLAQCPHDPPCGSATSCQNLVDIAAWKEAQSRAGMEDDDAEL